MGASKQAMMDEVDRIGREEYDEDGNPKTTGYEDLDDNAVIEEDLDELSGIPSRDNSAEEEEMKKFGGKARPPKTMGYDNDELVEVILNLQKKAEKDNG